LMTKGSVGEAFAKQGSNLRTGFARINANPVVTRGMRAFYDTDPTGTSVGYRTDFFNRLYFESSGNGLTPLRRAMDDVGKYFQTTGVDSPYAQNPGSSVGTEYSCRRNFHIMSTDGYWNDAAATSPANGNNDNFPGWTPATTPAKIDGTVYSFSDTVTPTSDPLVGRFTVNPFRDGSSNTLSDVAAYYWRVDLRGGATTGLANNVTPTARDQAFWQHLSSFTIGLGISGSGTVRRTSDSSLVVPTVPVGHPLRPYIGRPWLADQTTRDWLIDNKVELTWSTPTGDNITTGDDLIHASMVGRGRYFLASNPKDLADGLSSALAEVVDQPLDQAALAADSPQVRSGAHLLQATFSPAKWSGRLYSFLQDASTGLLNNRPSSTGNLNSSQVWEASLAMPAPASRNIFTSNGTAGSATTFTWANLTAAQRTAH
jgi:type IV pilus assembly protein PilY1